MILPTTKLWTGMPASRESESFPRMDLQTAPVRRCEISGRFTGLSSEGVFWAARRARLDPAVQMFVLVIDSGISAWYVEDAADALLRLSAEKPTLAYIKNAMGSTLLLATCCRHVFAHPHATIGGLSAWTDRPISDHDLATLNGTTMSRLADMRPSVNPHAWGQMLFNVFNGTAAEQLGVVDGLADSEAGIVNQLTADVPDTVKIFARTL